MLEVRAAARDLLATILLASGVTDPARVGRERLTIVTFHRVLPASQRAEYPLAGLAVTPQLFEWLLRWFAAHYECDTLARACRRLAETRSRPILALTFDDGQADNLAEAGPILDRVGLRATFFVTVQAVESGAPLWHDRLAYAAAHAQRHHREALAAAVTRILGAPLEGDGIAAPSALVGRAKALMPAEREALIDAVEAAAGGPRRPTWDGMMGWDQLAALVRAGHEVGSHSMSHALLPQCSDADLDREVAESRRAIEARLGVVVESFCYPNGDFDERSVAAVRRAGYLRAVTGGWRPNGVEDPPFTLRRCDMVEETSLDRRAQASAARIAWRLSGLHPGLR